MLRRPRTVFGLLICLFVCPFSVGCNSGSESTPPSSSSNESDVEVPTVELPEEPADENQGTADE
jgi:hypothetical protein